MTSALSLLALFLALAMPALASAQCGTENIVSITAVTANGELVSFPTCLDALLFCNDSVVGGRVRSACPTTCGVPCPTNTATLSCFDALFLSPANFSHSATTLSLLALDRPLEINCTQELLLQDFQVDISIIADFLRNFPAIKTLQLNNMSLQTVDSSLFASLPQLENLHLVNNSLRDLQFLSDPSLAARLKIFRLEGQLRPPTFGPGTLSPLKNLAVLVFRNMRLRSDDLPADAFASLSGLRFLGLAGNLLDDIRASWWTSSEQPVPIEALDIQHNEFSSLRSGTFDSLATSLARVDFSSNHLTALPEQLFGTNFSALTYCNWEFNNITSLPSDLLLRVPNATTMMLSTNRLTSLPSNLFAFSEKLSKVTLGGNQLTALSPDLFAGNPALAIVDLRDNLLSAVPVTLFNVTTQLRFLSLSRNQITRLPASLLNATTKLQSFLADGNRLSNVPALFFAPVGKTLTNLALFNNNLSTIPVLLNDMIALVDLSIGNNPIYEIQTDRFQNITTRKVPFHLNMVGAPSVCKTGFSVTLLGSPTISCSCATNYTGNVDCKPMACDPAGVVLPSNVYLLCPAYVPLGHVCKVFCGYTLQMAGKFECLANGLWSGSYNCNPFFTEVAPVLVSGSVFSVPSVRNISSFGAYLYALYGDMPLVRTRLTSPRLQAMAALRNVSLNIFTSEITGTVPQLTSAQWSEMLLDVLSNPLNNGLPHIYELNFVEKGIPRDFFDPDLYATDLITWDVLGIAPLATVYPDVDPDTYGVRMQFFYGGMETTLPNFRPFQFDSVNTTAGAPFRLALPVQTPNSDATMLSLPVFFQYSLAAESVLPRGLRLTANNGTISGIPLQNGTFPIVVELMEQTTGQRWIAARFTLRVAALLQTFDVTVTATVEQEFVGLRPHVTGGEPPLIFSVAVDAPLPPGLGIDVNTGVVYGTPLEPGSFFVQPRVSDANGAVNLLRGFALNVLQPLLLDVSLFSTPVKLTVFSPATVAVVASAALASPRSVASPLSYSLPPGSQLPPGLTLNAKSGTIAGTPVAFGNFSFYLRVLEADTGSIALVNNGAPFLIIVNGLTCVPGWTDHDNNAGTPCVQCPGGSQVPPNAVGSCQLCPAGWADDDANPATPCVVCKSSEPLFVPEGTVGFCNQSALWCLPGTEDHDQNASTPCVPVTLAVIQASHGFFTPTATAVFSVLLVLTVLLCVIVGVYAWRRHKQIQERMQPYKFTFVPLPTVDGCAVYTDGLQKPQDFQGLSLPGHTVSAVPREIKRGAITTLDCIGKGSFSSVYKGLLDEGRDSHGAVPEFTVALKVLKQSLTTEELDGFMREAAIMAQLRHPNVVSLVGVCTAGDPKMLVIQYCEHGSLHAFLQEHVGFNELQITSKLRILEDVARGMQFLASLLIVHRDLAARNVLVGADYICKIADYGLSRQIADSNADYYASSLGMIPLRWTAPEVLETRHHSTMSDVWSFGIFCGEVMDNGSLPYKNLTNEQVWLCVEAGGHIDCSGHCPPVLFDAVIRPCFAKNSAERPSFAVLTGILSSINSLNASSELATSDGNFPRHDRSSLTPSIPDSRNTSLEKDSGKIAYIRPESSTLSSSFSQPFSSFSRNPDPSISGLDIKAPLLKMDLSKRDEKFSFQKMASGSFETGPTMFYSPFGPKFANKLEEASNSSISIV